MLLRTYKEEDAEIILNWIKDEREFASLCGIHIYIMNYNYKQYFKKN